MSKGKLVNYCTCTPGDDDPNCPLHNVYVLDGHSDTTIHEEKRLDEACRERPHLKED